MFKRPHHQRILTVLQSLNATRLLETQCYFGGGTAIVLQLHEYRESVDMDFLCASREGYRLLRNEVTSHSLGGIAQTALVYRREVRADRYGIRTVLDVDGVPIKLEIVSEGRIGLSGSLHPTLSVPTLRQEDLMAEKILANADRGADRSTFHRDLIDLAMMLHYWGPIPATVWQRVMEAYGQQAVTAYQEAVARIAQPPHLADCLKALRMDLTLSDAILSSLQAQQPPQDFSFS